MPVPHAPQLPRPRAPRSAPRTDWTLLTAADARALVESPFLSRGLKLHLVGWIGPDAARLRFVELKADAQPV
ncbi:MAG: hypothetical protein J0I06_14435 [Planctomycetes bacterium]|nr:hypothetical protein [Planctomycetota bacterium]